MTPKQFAQQYWNLQVPFEDGPINVRVACYRSGIHSSPVLSKAMTLVDGKNETYQVSVRTIRGAVDFRTYNRANRKQLLGTIQDPFNGKGSPEEVQVLLQVAVKCGFLKKERVPAFCASGDIGLDCCGFVSNYVWHAVMKKPWDVDTGKKDLAASNYIPAMMAAGRPVKTEEDLIQHSAQCLVFAKADETGKVIKNGPGAHVMITEPNTLMRMHGTSSVVTAKGRDNIQYKGQNYTGRVKSISNTSIVVVESTGGGKGLVDSRYTVLSVNETTGVFLMKRGCSQGTLSLRVATLAPSLVN